MGILILPLLLLLGSGTEEAIVTTTIITSEVLIIFIMLVCKLSTAQSNYPELVSTGVRAALPPLVATLVFIQKPTLTFARQMKCQPLRAISHQIANMWTVCDLMPSTVSEEITGASSDHYREMSSRGPSAQ